MSSIWKECRDQERLKMWRKKSTLKRGRRFSMGWATLSGPVAVDEDMLEAAAKNSAGEKAEQKNK